MHFGHIRSLALILLTLTLFSCSTDKGSETKEPTALEKLKEYELLNLARQEIKLGEFMSTLPKGRPTLLLFTSKFSETNKIGIPNLIADSCKNDSINFVLIYTDSLENRSKYELMIKRFAQKKKGDDVKFDMLFDPKGLFQKEHMRKKNFNYVAVGVENDSIVYENTNSVNDDFIYSFMEGDLFKTFLKSDSSKQEGLFEVANTRLKYAFKNRKPSGDWTIHYGDTLISSMRHNAEGQRHGSWKQYNNNKLQYEVKYENGLRQGKYVSYFENGNPSQTGNYKNDLKDGETIVYYEEGSIYKKYSFRNDSLNGKFESFYEDGKLNTKGQYLNDELEGNWVSYSEDGTKLKDANYKEGKLNGPYTSYYSNGSAELKGKYIMGEPDGEFIRKFEDGSVNYKRKWDNGKLIDVLIYRDMDGNNLELGTFADGNGLLNVYNSYGDLISVSKYIDGEEVEDYYEKIKDQEKFDFLKSIATETLEPSSEIEFADLSAYKIGKYAKYYEEDDDYNLVIPIEVPKTGFVHFTIVGGGSWGILADSLINSAIEYRRIRRENTFLKGNGKKIRYNYVTYVVQGGHEIIQDDLRGKTAYLSISYKPETYKMYSNRDTYVGYHVFNTIEEMEAYRDNLRGETE